MNEGQEGSGSSPLKIAGMVALAFYVVISLYFSYQLSHRIAALEAKQAEAEEKLGKKLSATEARLKDTSQMVDETQSKLDKRAAELARQQRSVESKLSEEQKQRQAALGEVTGQVIAVKSDVGGVKSEVSATKSELEATKAKLESLKGDLGIQSGLIATTREDLELLRRKGERNYTEFTLAKGKPTPVSTVSLQLKKTDQKKGKFTLNVIADDRTIEKKDRTMNEPLQFYAGRERQLYEVVVFEVGKNQVSGYLSTPKHAQAMVR